MIDIEPATGLVCLKEEDFSLNGENSLFFTRRYSNFSTYQGPFGAGWTFPYDVHLVFQDGELSLRDGEARNIQLAGLSQCARVELPSEGLIAENAEDRFLLHQGEGETLTFSKTPLRDGKLPLVRIDQTDENSIFLSYREGLLNEIRTTSFHRLRLSYREDRIERISLHTREGGEVTLAVYTYNDNGQLVAVCDAEDKTRTYEYSGELLARHTNRMGGSYYLQYDRHRRALAVWQDGLTRVRRVCYDDKNRTRRVIDSRGYSNLLRYNKNKLLVGATRFDGSQVERAYTNGNEPIAVIGAGSQPVCEYDAAARVVEETDPDGSVSRLKFDERDRVVEETDPDGGITRYEYDDRNRITRQVDPLGGVNLLSFNENGNLVTYVQPLGNTIRAVRSETGRLELEDSLGPLYVSEHDSFGNTTRTTAPSGRTTNFEYDRFGRLISLETNGHVARNWYDANGHLIAETDLAGNRTEYERDPFGLLLAWTNPMGRRIEYLYDSERRLIGGRSSDGIECRYEYDSHGRLVHMKLRDGREETINYDDDGLRSAISDSGGHVTRYAYTPSGRLSGIESPTGSAHYEYDEGGNCNLAEYDDQSVAREWGPGERLISEQQGDFLVEYEHDAVGSVVLRSDSTGRITRYRYDVRGQLAEIDDSLLGVFEFRRDPIGSETEQHLPIGLVREFEYGVDDEIARVVTRNAAGKNVCERTYRFATNGEMIEAETNGGERLRFQYDREYQLTAVLGAADDAEAFSYDLDHNIVHESNRGEYRFEGRHLVSAGDISYQYDNSRRVTAKLCGERGIRFVYGLGGLVSEAILSDDAGYCYKYDGLGRRVMKTGPGIRVRYYWDQDVLLCEERETSQGKSIVSYLFLPDTFLPLGHAVDGTCFYYELDQRSLVREVYDANGDTVARFAYRAYGKRRTLDLSSPQADPPFRLQGQTWDEETALHYNRFRYYDADIGRFLSPDLSTHQVEHNSYSYSPNPINWADPYGLMARFSTSDALAFVEEQGEQNGGFECSNCGFKNTNRVFARTAKTGRPVGDGAFHAGHKKAHANNGSGNIKRNAKVEGGTCNCSKGKRKSSGMT